MTLTQKTDIEIQLDNQINYFNDLEKVYFFVNGHYFNDYFNEINNSLIFDFDSDLETNGELNIYIINLEETTISSHDYSKINEILLAEKDVIIYFLGGSNYDFLEGYIALSTDREGNDSYLNLGAYIVRLDNLDDVVKITQVMSEDSMEMLFSDSTYLQYRVYHKIQRDLINYYKEK
jgi:hypothetical protein